MKRLLALIAFSLSLATACEESDMISDTTDGVPIVTANATFEVTVTEDIVYAEGFSHEIINSADPTLLPLYLDIYTPNNDMDNRPVFMFIHGGGFSGGSKQQSQIVEWADFFASRGWVFVSIDYRLERDNGSVPQAWVDFSTNISSTDASQFLAIYPAQRDAKAAMRWIVANANTYNINTDYITVGGGSAGAITAITLGITDQQDYRDEISSSMDPSLASTNLNQNYQVKTIIDLWGSKIAVDAIQDIYGHMRFDSSDPPLFIAHGTEDPTVAFSNAQDLKDIYDDMGLVIDFHPIEGRGHGAWNATVNNKSIQAAAFEFIIEQQDLVVQ